jgi:hypothetical protein
MPAEGTRGNGEELRALKEERDHLKEELDVRRLQAEQEKDREKVRGRLAVWLVGLLSFVLVATYVYFMILALYFYNDLPREQATQEITTVIPMIGTTLLTPLVGLIGAVTGFYFGGLTATQAASQGHAAAQAAHQQGAEAATKGGLR